MTSTSPESMNKTNLNDLVSVRGEWPSCRPAMPQLTVPMLATAGVLDETGTCSNLVVVFILGHSGYVDAWLRHELTTVLVASASALTTNTIRKNYNRH